MSRPRSAIAFLAWLGVSLLTGALGGIASRNAPAFYAQLVKPAWAPPAWLFGPAWTTLYVLMGISAFLVWRTESSRSRSVALNAFLAHLVLNALWSWCFFEWRLGAGSFGEILLLWASIVALVVMFAGIRPLAALLLVPYVLWVTFASALTWSVWQSNPLLLR